MFRPFSQHLRQQGFTLVELMVVILIISILVAISIPTFIGIRYRGYDSTTKSTLRNAVTTAQTYYTDQHGSYTGMNAVALGVIERSISFKDGAISTDEEVYISNVTDQTYTLSCRSKSQSVFTASSNGTVISYNF